MAQLGRTTPQSTTRVGWQLVIPQRWAFARPDADVDAASWTTAPLFSKIDEATPDTSDEISSETLGIAGSTSIYKARLEDVADPQVATDHELRVWYKATFTLGTTASGVVELREGGVLRATLTATLTASYQSFVYLLSAAEANAITDYTNLEVWFYGTFGVGNLGGVQITWFEFAEPATVATSATNAPAGVATGTGVANDAQVSLAPGSGNAGATGAAGGPTSLVSPNVGVATGAGVGNDATVSLSPGTGVAGATGAAGGPTSTVAPVVGVATGAGAANNATVSLSPGTGVAGATGAAGGPTSTVSPTSGVATGTGAANDASTTLSAGTGVAGGTGSSGGPTSSVAPVVGVATGSGAANDATVSLSTVVNAGVATGSGTAGGPGSSVAPGAGAATAVGAAYDATITALTVGAPGRIFAWIDKQRSKTDLDRATTEVSAEHGSTEASASRGRTLTSVSVPSTHTG